MMQTPNPTPPSTGSAVASAEHPTSNVELSVEPAGLGDGRSTPGIWPLLLRLVGIVVGGVFIYAGVLKMLDPVQFAGDIDNYQMLPWMLSAVLGFYLPWLEIACGLTLILRFLPRGGLAILIGLVVVFIGATIAARVRGLDITCGCFGHASQHWSFPAHMAVDLSILAGLIFLAVASRAGRIGS